MADDPDVTAWRSWNEKGVPLSAIRALVQQLMADADDARNRGYLEAWNTYQVCANHVAALCPAPPEET